MGEDYLEVGVGGIINSWKNLRLQKKCHQKFLAEIGNKITKGATNLKSALGG